MECSGGGFKIKGDVIFPTRNIDSGRPYGPRSCSYTHVTRPDPVPVPTWTCCDKLTGGNTGKHCLVTCTWCVRAVEKLSVTTTDHSVGRWVIGRGKSGADSQKQNICSWVLIAFYWKKNMKMVKTEGLSTKPIRLLKDLFWNGYELVSVGKGVHKISGDVIFHFSVTNRWGL